jgi:hypothetical protein
MKLRAALCATLILLCVSRSHLPPAYASGSADEAWQGTISVDFKSHVETDTTDALMARYHVLERTVARHATATSAVYSSIRLSAETETEWTGTATVDLHTSATDYTLDSRTDPAPAYEEKGYDAATSGATTAQGSVRFFRNTDEKDPRKARCHVEVDAQDDWRDRPELKVSRTGRNWRFFRPPEPSASWDYAINDKVALAPTFVGFDFACDPDGTAYSGQQLMKMNPDGTTTQLVTWSIHRGPLPETEVELIPPGEYGQWLPQAGDDEKTIGNYIEAQIVAHKKDDPNSPPPKQVLKYTVTLQKTSREKGVNLNWPLKGKDDYDLKLDATNPLLKITGDADQAQSAETTQQDIDAFIVRVNCYDWGGYTNLAVTAELSDHTTVKAHVRGSGQQSLAIPKDDDGNHIADSWEESFGLHGGDPASDDDSQPAGHEHNGDSIALYDEYRGFRIQGKPERLSPVTKDLFIWDASALGSGLYQASTGVTPRLINEMERTYGGSAGNIYIVTPNGHYGDVHPIWLHTGSIAKGVVGETQGGWVPSDIIGVTIDPSEIVASYGAQEPELQVTIAHELSHATNVRHHGGKPPDYLVGDVVCHRGIGPCPQGDMACLQKQGSVKNLMCTERSKNDPLGKPGTECFEVAGKGGAYSGNDTCIMRYDLTNFYEDPKGVCTAKHNGATVTLSFFGTDPPGVGKLCTSNKGTGVNDTSKPPNKAGDATRGNCASQVCLKNGAHEQ